MRQGTFQSTTQARDINTIPFWSAPEAARDKDDRLLKACREEALRVALVSATTGVT